MAITATLTNFEQVRGVWRVSILYTDTVSTETIERSYRFNAITKKQLVDLAKREAFTLESNDTTDVDVPIGTTIDVTPDPVIPPTDPTPEEIAKEAWFDDYRQLKQVLEVTRNVPDLLNAQATTLITNLRASLTAGWDNSYLGDL